MHLNLFQFGESETMKFPFHVTLLALMLSLLILTGMAIGVTSYLNARHTVGDLSQQVLGHAAMRIDEQVDQLLLGAVEQSELNRDLLESRWFSGKDYPRLAAHWVKVMKQHRRFTALGFTLEATGEVWYVKRGPDGKLVVSQSHRNARTGRLELR